MKTAAVILLGVACACVATELRIVNYGDAPLKTMVDGVQVVCPQGQTIALEVADNSPFTVRWVDTDVENCVATDSGLTVVTVGMNGTNSQPVVAIEGKADSMGWFNSGFGLGLTLYGFGLILRIMKKSVNHSVE